MEAELEQGMHALIVGMLALMDADGLSGDSSLLLSFVGLNGNPGMP